MMEDGELGQIFPLFDDEDGVAFFQLTCATPKIGYWEGEVHCWNQETSTYGTSYVVITTKGIDYDDIDFERSGLDDDDE